MSVAAEPTLAAQASARRNGIGLRPRREQPSASTGANGQADNIVGQQRAEQPRDGDQNGQERIGRDLQRGDLAGDARVKTPKAELGGNHHEAKEQGDWWERQWRARRPPG